MVTRNKDGKKSTDFRDLKFLEIPLTDEQRNEVKVWFGDPDIGVEDISKAVELNYVIKIKKGKGGRSYVAQANGDHTLHNHGLILATSAGSAYKALMVLLYKMGVVKEWGAWEEEQVDDDWFS